MRRLPLGLPPWLLLLLLLPLATAITVTPQRCKIYLAASDVSRDDSLNREPEFTRFVSVLTGGQYATYASTPAPFQAVYDKYAATSPNGELPVAGARPGSTPTPAQSATLQAMCTDFIALIPAATPTPAVVATPVPAVTPVPGGAVTPPATSPVVSVPFPTCRVSMAVSDLNRDNALSQQEYVAFLNRITANQRGFTTFAGLPAGLQSTFTTLAVAGGSTQIDITGASPATFNSATEAQKASLEKICTDAQVTLNDQANAGTGPPTSTAVTAAPGPSVGAGLPPAQCRVSLAIADADRDNQVTAQEYVSFINRLTRNQYAGAAFADLPADLQTNFNTLAAATPPATTMDVTGAQPAQYAAATPDQKAFLDKICADTQAITTQSAATTPPAATPVPATAAPVATAPPGITLVPFIQCRAMMHGHDTDRNYLLSQEEYAAFVDQLTPGVTYPTFESLPPAVQANYAAFATDNGQINIYGAIPSQQTDAVQLAKLEELCTDTQVAIGGQATVPPPTIAPVAVPPTYGPVPPISCGTYMQNVDVDNNERLDQAEYATFVWLMTNNERFISYSWDQLPEALKANFQQWSLDGVSWDVTASDQGLPPGTVTDAQLQRLAAMCAATTASINQWIIATSTPPPTVPPKVVTPLPQCKIYMDQADADNNFQLTPLEYVGFVNQLGGQSVGWTPVASYELLPPVLQGAFSGLSEAGAYIDITGASLNPPATPAQDARLQQICTVMDEKVYASLPHGGSPAPTPLVETIPPTPQATVALNECKFVYLQQVDLDKTMLLNTEEYAGFVNLMSLALGLPIAGNFFAEFHPALQQNFKQLAAVDLRGTGVTDAIDIFGSTVESALTATPEQLQHINTICVNTAYTIQDALAPPSPAPTLGPTLTVVPTVTPPATEAPTIFVPELKIYNSFIVTVQAGVTGLEDPDNPSRKKFEALYKDFIRVLLPANPYTPGATTAPVVGRFLRGQGERQLVSYMASSANLVHFEETVCPDGVVLPRPLDCQKVYAEYIVEAVERGAAADVRRWYTDLTQSHMTPPAIPNLKQYNVANNPGSPIDVLQQTETAEEYVPPPTARPTPAPAPESKDNTIAAVTTVGILALIALGIYFAWNDKEKIKRKFRAYKKAQRENVQEEDLEDNDILDGESKPPGAGEEGEEDFEEGEEYEDEYDDEYDIEDGGKPGKKGKRAKKLLGNLGKGVGKLGKKVGLMDEDDDDLGFGFQDENLLDFEDYVFDTPAELLTEQNRAVNKFGEEVNAKDRGGRDAMKRGALGSSFISGGQPSTAMTDSVASSTSSMEGSEMSEEYDFDEFEDEFDSDDSDSEEEDEDSFGLSLSDSEGDGEDTISSKGDDFRDDDAKDDGSLSSSDEHGEGTALVGDNIDGMLEAARANGEDGEGSEDGENDDDGSESGSSYYSESTSSSQEARLVEYRNEVKELVSKVIPEELDNLSTMMDQFEGREAELINTLQNMEERTSTQRARAAVHKTKLKANPNQVGGYSIASEGSAVIAAASTLGPEPQRRQPRVQQYDDYDDYDDYSGSYSDEYYDDEDGSYYSEDYDSQAESYYSGDEEYDDEYYSGDEEYDDEYGEEGDEEYDDEYSGEDDDDEYSGEYDDDYDSQVEGSQEGDGSYYSGDEEDYSGDEEDYSGDDYDEEGGSYEDGEGEYDDDYDSQFEGSQEGDGSYYSGEEGEDQSYYSGDEEFDDQGSYHSGDEGSQSQYSDDDYYDDEEGSYDDG